MMRHRLHAFHRPAAHRGVHHASAGVFENTMPAFEAAIAAGVAIECDVQRTRDDDLAVFHDATLDRLCGRPDPVDTLALDTLEGIAVGEGPARIPALASLLAACSGAVPLIVEVKASTAAAGPRWLHRLTALANDYPGPLALKSFDATILSVLRASAVASPLGLVCSNPAEVSGADAAAADFLSVSIAWLPSADAPAKRPACVQPPTVMAWTVRSEGDLARAVSANVAPVFEGLPVERVTAAWAARRDDDPGWLDQLPHLHGGPTPDAAT